MADPTPRALGRALLARQQLLTRAAVDPVDQVAHLVGLQSQNPSSAYLGLWSRLARFEHAELGDALVDRRLVRVSAMRGTVHLLTAADARLLPGLHADRQRVELRANAARRRALDGVDVAAVAGRARALLTQRPCTPAELGALLAREWPGVEPVHLAAVARGLLPLAQVPPRGRWRRPGCTTWTTVGTWLGDEGPDLADPAVRAAARADLLLRYLAAFGPATVADAQAWSGLTGLRTAAQAVRDRLVAIGTSPGPGPARELLDLPDGPRPDPGSPAPVRFLPDFDNVLLGHADRSRVLPADLRARLASRNGLPPATVLVDGAVAGTWAVRREPAGSGRPRTVRAVLAVTPWRAWSRSERADAVAEGEAMVRFWADDATEHDVVVSG